jgi:hypothetical protein
MSLSSIDQHHYFVTNPATREAFTAAGAAGALLLLEHLALWDEPFRLNRAQAYALGTVTLGACFTWWALRARMPSAAVAWWLIAALGGTPVMVAYWVRWVLGCLDGRALHAGQVAGKDVTHNGHNARATTRY